MKTIQLTDYYIDLRPISKSLQNYIEKQKHNRIAIICDEHTKAQCYPLISFIDEHNPLLIEIVSGEENKSLSTCEQIWSSLIEKRFDRHDLIINLGGGVIGDMGGFTASCYMRGIDFIQIPTTLLSQVDASIGGKLAIDFNQYKNMIGLFKNPKAVFIDPQFLTTLPKAELRSGFAEMVKHALIKDLTIWNQMLSQSDWKAYINNESIYQSIQIKKNVVVQDPTEKGLRKILNFGHTIGHAVESHSFTTLKPLLHGEAIAIGMMIEAYLSVQLTGLSKDSYQQIIDFLTVVYGNVDPNYLTDIPSLLSLMKGDKKNKDGEIRFSLLQEIGNCSFDIAVNEDLIAQAIKGFSKQH